MVFSVTSVEPKSARKGPVLERSIVITQTAHAGDVLIFKEAIRRMCAIIKAFNIDIKFIDNGAEPVNDLRTNVKID